MHNIVKPAVAAAACGRTGLVGSVCMLLLAASGCGQSEEIRSYTVPRETTGPAETKPGETAAAKVRLLGAVIPQNNELSWFVKFSGPTEQISPHVETIEQFVRSLQIKEGGQLTWTAPPGWSQQPQRTMRLVTFVPPGDGKQPELYISTPFGGSLLANVNRWRGEVGLPEITENQLADVVREIPIAGGKAYWVDFQGPGGKSRMPPFVK